MMKVAERKRSDQPGRSSGLSKALQESEERFRQLVSGVEDCAIFLLDSEGYIMSWNAGAQRIKGYSTPEVVGKHFSVFYTREAIERAWPQLELSVAREKGRFADEGWRLRKDGSQFWASTVINTFRGADGNVRGFLTITRDLSERSKYEAALAESEERFRLLVDGVQEYAIFMLDPQGIVVSWNRGGKMIKGYEASEIVGSHFSLFYPQEAVLHGKPAWELEMAKRYGSFEDEGWRIRKDGSRFWANVVITSLRDKDGSLRGFAKVTRDMTERRKIEQLEEADRQKDQFLALLAHELRNPLAPIRTALDVLRQPNATPDVAVQAREIAERQLRHMARLLDDLLDVSRIREGRIELRKEALEVAAALRSAARLAIDDRRHELTVTYPATPIFVSADPVRLEQVLGNLLNNAIKYTDPGGKIWLTAERGNGEVIIRVRDSGIGIEPLMIPRVFDLFVQGERRTEHSAGGVGIGLSVVKKLIELHDGRVEVFSAGAGKGSEFVVVLPAVEPGSRERNAVTDQSSAPAPARKLRVLLVDDNADSADGLALLLDLQGHDVRVAYDGESALEAARSFRPDVALLDIGMPSMNGYELARRLRAAPETKKTLLVAMTGWGQEEDRRKGREAGFAHHLVKPFEPSAVQKLLADFSAAG
jgi:PAS domain S-box-containing protein